MKKNQTMIENQAIQNYC